MVSPFCELWIIATTTVKTIQSLVCLTATGCRNHLGRLSHSVFHVLQGAALAACQVEVESVQEESRRWRRECRDAQEAAREMAAHEDERRRRKEERASLPFEEVREVRPPQRDLATAEASPNIRPIAKCVNPTSANPLTRAANSPEGQWWRNKQSAFVCS